MNIENNYFIHFYISIRKLYCVTMCFSNRDRSIYVMDSSNFTDMKINYIEFMMNMRHEPPTSAYIICLCTSLTLHLTLIETLPSTTYNECGLVVFIKVDTTLTIIREVGRTPVSCLL